MSDTIDTTTVTVTVEQVVNATALSKLLVYPLFQKLCQQGLGKQIDSLPNNKGKGRRIKQYEMPKSITIDLETGEIS